MHNAMESLELDCLNIIYPGRQQFKLADNVHVWPLMDYVLSNLND